MQGLLGGAEASGAAGAAGGAASSGLGASLAEAVGQAQEGNFGNAYQSVSGGGDMQQDTNAGGRQAGGLMNPGAGRQRYGQLQQNQDQFGQMLQQPISPWYQPDQGSLW
jgi:hypothetical protein